MMNIYCIRLNIWSITRAEIYFISVKHNLIIFRCTYTCIASTHISQINILSLQVNVHFSTKRIASHIQMVKMPKVLFLIKRPLSMNGPQRTACLAKGYANIQYYWTSLKALDTTHFRGSVFGLL